MKRLLLMLAFVAVFVCSKAAILEDGKMWIMKYFNPDVPDPTEIQYSFLKFYVDGEIICNGKVCKRVKLKDDVMPDDPPFLLYEEDDVLYYFRDIFDYESFWDYYEEYSVDGAFPIIDFNCQVGDTLRDGCTKVVSIDDVVIRDVSRKVVKLTKKFPTQAYWIKDIGLTNECYVTPPYHCTGSVMIMESCYQGDTCLYKAGDLPDSDFGGIESVAIDIAASGIVYDMMGRCVEHPQRGSLYIRGGKKLIWQD